MSQSARILVADDDESFLENVARMLRFVGYHCDRAPNGEAARQCLMADPYDLLVADIEMSGNEHLELVEWSAGHDTAMSVLLVTGHPTVPTAVQAFKLPVAAYLEKPSAPPTSWPRLAGPSSAPACAGRWKITGSAWIRGKTTWPSSKNCCKGPSAKTFVSPSRRM
jgi:CheY-like chemotaxis protein